MALGSHESPFVLSGRHWQQASVLLRRSPLAPPSYSLRAPLSSRASAVTCHTSQFWIHRTNRGRSCFGKTRQLILGLGSEGKEMNAVIFKRVTRQISLMRKYSSRLFITNLSLNILCEGMIEKPKAKLVKNEQVWIIWHQIHIRKCPVSQHSSVKRSHFEQETKCRRGHEK